LAKNTCPYCGIHLENSITRKQQCPHCQKNIFVRSSELVTEDESVTLDWLVKLESFGIDRRAFEIERNKLSKQFGTRACAHDTIWKILNQLLVNLPPGDFQLSSVYGLMADFVADEGRDPTRFLIEAINAGRLTAFQNKRESLLREKELAEEGSLLAESPIDKIIAELGNLKYEVVNEANLKNTKLFLLYDSHFTYIRKMVKEGKFQKAENLLYMALPTPAVLDELRKLASKKARLAKKDGDWRRVVEYLEGYNNYANEWKTFCIKKVKQAPPEHTKRDKNLLQEAKKRVRNNK